MRASEQLHMFCVFTAAIRNLRPQVRTIPACNPTFTSVIEKAKEEGNLWAKRITLRQGIAGKKCLDFERGLSMAQTKGVVSLLTPNFSHMLINMTSEHAQRYTETAGFDSMLSLATSYLEKLAA